METVVLLPGTWKTLVHETSLCEAQPPLWTTGDMQVHSTPPHMLEQARACTTHPYTQNMYSCVVDMHRWISHAHTCTLPPPPALHLNTMQKVACLCGWVYACIPIWCVRMCMCRIARAHTHAWTPHALPLITLHCWNLLLITMPQCHSGGCMLRPTHSWCDQLTLLGPSAVYTFSARRWPISWRSWRM